MDQNTIDKTLNAFSKTIKNASDNGMFDSPMTLWVSDHGVRVSEGPEADMTMLLGAATVTGLILRSEGVETQEITNNLDAIFRVTAPELRAGCSDR